MINVPLRLRRIVLDTILLMVLFVAVKEGLDRAFAGAGEGARILAVGIVPALAVIAGTVYFEMRASGASVANAVRSLGAGRPNGEQLLVAALACTPLLLAYGLALTVFGVPAVFKQPIALVVLETVVAQGLMEELLYRGFVFRHLRRGRSFLRAALLGGAIFGLAHLVNLRHGITGEAVASVLVSIVAGFAYSLPAGYLYERGGRSVWGFVVIHVAVDAVNWLGGADMPAAPTIAFLVATVCTGVLVFPLASRILAPSSPALLAAATGRP